MTQQFNDEVLIRAEHVSKKFCRSLKRSLWYGVQDVATALMPWKQSQGLIQGEETSQFPLPVLRSDEFWAVQDVSFEVKRGECLGLIGHNGAGKSTLLKMLNSLNRPDAGRITMRGRIGALIELNAGFNPILSGRENIYNQAALLGFSRQETDAKFDAIVAFSELEGFLDMPVQNYSSGMRVRLGFSIAAQMEPDILIIDEVLAVGDVGFRFKCINKMAELMNHAAVIFVSHSMPQILRVCNTVINLEKGRVVYQGSDVFKGVDSYYQRFPRQEQTIVGAGNVDLVSIWLESPRAVSGFGEPLELDHGETLNIEMTLRIGRTIPEVVVQVLFWSMEMLPVLDVIGPELHGFRVKNHAQEIHTIGVKLTDLILNSGSHFLSVIASSPDYSTHYLRHDNAAVVRMTTRTQSGAQSVVNGYWEYKGAD